MPYKIIKKDDKYTVVSEDGEEVKGTHASRGKALAQIRALYANVEDTGIGEAIKRRLKK